MHISSSPSLGPAVLVESPKSPPRGYLFTRSGSISPERRGYPHRGGSPANTAIQPASRPDSPRVGGQGPNTKRGNSQDPHSKSNIGTRKPPPPPVNRADKPKIPAKPSAPLQVPHSVPQKTTPTREVSNPRISPFSTPPSSEGSPSPERHSRTRGLESLEPRLSELSMKDKQQLDNVNDSRPSPAPSLLKDPRLLGFSSSAQALHREVKDPRAMGLSAAIADSQSSSTNGRRISPQRSVSHVHPERSDSLRDPRNFGFPGDGPSSFRESRDNTRKTPLIPAVERKTESSASRAYRDPRTMGFSNGSRQDTAPDAEKGPGLPPRRLDAIAPPRPPETSKHSQSKLRADIVPPRPVDRSSKPTANKIGGTPQTTVSSATYFPPPPKRGTLPAEQSPRASIEVRRGSRQESVAAEREADDSDDVEEAIGDATTARTNYPDITQSNRRPPFFTSGVEEILTRYDTRVFDVCGQHVCTSGYVSRAWDLTNGDNVMTLGHGETVKVLTVIFKPAANLEDEGSRIWIGNNIGDLHEIDIMTQSIIATSSVHNRREIQKMLRHKKDIWSLDDDGKLFVWPADESGVPNMRYSPHSHKVQKGYSFAIVVGDNLWLATGKELRVYRPGSDIGFQVAQKPLLQSGTGDITSGTLGGFGSEKVFFGHTDGRVTIYNTKNQSCIANVKASDYKINAMALVGDLLWAAYKTGKIYVYDTSVSPWKVKKDWKAHDGPVVSMMLDTSGIWTINRLQILSLGQDNCIRCWDAMLEDDWVESEMQQRDVDYCRFREIRASVLTWNVGASSPYDIRNDFLADAIHVEDPPEILVFGFQELIDLEDKAVTAKNILGLGKKKDASKAEHISRVYREWRDYLGKCIHRYMDTSVSYTEVHTSSLIGLFLCVFVRQDEKRNIRGVSAADVKCGMKGHYGNKGALILRFVYDDSSVCFVNCHLAAGQSQTSHRNNDVATILEAEALPSEPNLDVRASTFSGGGDGTQILDHEICVLNGDLNYRIDSMPRNTVVDLVKRNELSKLLERDQIMVCRRRVWGFRLGSFVEAPITFAPTYKYDVGTDNYDTSEKKRAPAWCDRLLYRGPGRIKQLEYRRHEVRVSDHRPVSGTFKIRIKRIDQSKRATILEDCVASFATRKAKMAADARYSHPWMTQSC